MLDTSLLDEVSCLTVSIIGGKIIVNLEVCDPECIYTEGRTLVNCYFSTSYSCSDNLVSSGGDVWEINGDVATTQRHESVSAFEASIQEYFSDWEFDPGFELGDDCAIISDITLTK